MRLENCVLIKAENVTVGDIVRFKEPCGDYIVEEVSTNKIGQVQHIADSGCRTCGYNRGELLYVEKN